MELDHVLKPIIRCCSSKQRTLPDDMLVEIFLRLPDKPLVSFKALSKQWYFLISQICFQRLQPVVGLFVRTYKVIPKDSQYLVRASRTPFSAYFTKDCLPWKVSRVGKLGHYAPLEENGCIAGDERGRLMGWEECLSSYGLPFMPDPDDLLGCCNGLLLFVDTDTSQYYVSNPLTRQSVTIPRPPFTQETYLYAALAFDPSQSTCYKVVRFEWSIYLANVILDIYSSAKRSWSRHSLQVDPRARKDIWLRPVTYFDGAFFRLSMTWHLIRFGLEEVSISVTDLPLTYKQCNGLMGCMGVQMGRFCYANEYCNMVHIWSLEKCVDNDIGRWNLRHKINIYDLTSGLLLNREYAPAIAQWIGPIAFHPSSNVVYMGSNLVILSYNLENNSLEELFRIEKDNRLENNVFFPGCYYPAFSYVRFLAPFTEAGDIRDDSNF